MQQTLIAGPYTPLAERPRDAPSRRGERAHIALVPQTALPRPTWATPTREARADALLRAYRAEPRDAGQRILLREMLSHFRAACESAGHADPLANPAPPRRREHLVLAATG